MLKRFPRRLLVGTLALVVLISAGLSGCAGSSSGSKDETIRFGFSGRKDAIENMLGFKALEYLKDEGWKLDIKFLNGSTATTKALLAKDADVVEVSGTAGLVALAQDADMVSFASHDSKPKYILVTKNTFKDLASLSSAKFAVAEQKGIESATGSVIMKNNKLDWAKIQTVIVGSSGERAKALLAGGIDGTFLNFPQWPAFAQAGGYTILASAAEAMPYMMDDVIWSSKDWLQKHEDFALDLNKALIKAARWLDDPANKDEVLKYAATLVPSAKPEDNLTNYQQLLKLDMWPVNGNLSVENGKKSVEILIQYGVIKDGPKDDKWINSAYQDKALNDLGKK